MQKNVGKNTKRLYLITAIISFLLVIAIALTLVLALGGRSTGGSNNSGTNSGTVGSITTELYQGSTKMTGALSATAGTSYNITAKNTSDVPVYIRVNVIFDGSSSTTGNYFDYDDTKWTYAADNYLYYSDKVEKNAPTTSFFKTAKVAGTYRFIVEALQEDAAVPKVAISGVTSVTAGTSSSSSKAVQYGLLQQYGTLAALGSKSATKDVTIKNDGKQDLDVKFRISSSEWMVESAKVGTNARTVDWYPNAGYYQLVGKLAVGETATIKLGDANKNNNINVEQTTIYFTFQDYIVATDLYSLVNSSLQNVGTKVANENYTYTIPAGKGSDLYVYSYSNTDKFVYVQISGTTESYTLNSAWGNFEGESTGVSGTVISPKSKSAKLFDTAPTGAFTIKVWTAQKIDNATIDVISGATLNGSSNNYQPVTITGTPTKVTTNNMILAAGTSHTETEIKNKWGSLAIKSDDSSDMLVRVSLSFSWGSLSGSTWTPSTDALGFTPSVFYGDGFSFNSEDQSLTYNYNLSKGQATSALLDFTDTATSGTTRATELTKMVAAINEKNQALKLSIMVEAIYAVGSQLDILKLTGTPTSVSGSYYTTDEIESKYSSMTKTSTMITGDASTLASDLSKYVVYVTNNFPVGVRVAVALQWGTKASDGTWTPSTTNPNSSVNLGQYLSSNWIVDEDLGGYNYKCSIPGKCATFSIFDNSLLTNATTGLAAALATEATAHSGQTLRVIIMAETTHKV